MSCQSHKALRRPRQSKPSARPGCKLAARSLLKTTPMKSQPLRKLPARLRGCESNCPTAIARKRLASGRRGSLAARQARQHTLESTPKRRARPMENRLECDGGSTRHVCARAPCIILSARCGQHVGVAKVIVNNNPETMKVPRRSFRTAASWCFAPAPSC